MVDEKNIFVYNEQNDKFGTTDNKQVREKMLADFLNKHIEFPAYIVSTNTISKNVHRIYVEDAFEASYRLFTMSPDHLVATVKKDATDKNIVMIDMDAFTFGAFIEIKISSTEPQTKQSFHA